MAAWLLVLTIMPEFIVTPAENVSESRVRIALSGDDYILFGSAEQGEEATGSEYRTEDVDLASALADHPLLQVEQVEDPADDAPIEVRPTKAELVNEALAEDERQDPDAIRAVLFPDEDSAKPADRATTTENAPKQPEPPATHLSRYSEPSQEDQA